jgi:hypothetical protein
MLAQFRIQFVDIKIAILELNEDILDAETVEKMIPACPTAEETIQITAYEGDLKLLGKAEQYVYYTRWSYSFSTWHSSELQGRAVRHDERVPLPACVFVVVSLLVFLLRTPQVLPGGWSDRTAPDAPPDFPLQACVRGQG